MIVSYCGKVIGYSKIGSVRTVVIRDDQGEDHSLGPDIDDHWWSILTTNDRVCVTYNTNDVQGTLVVTPD